MAKTKLTLDQINQCLATGATIADVRALQSDEFEFDEILAICQTASNAKKTTDDARMTAQADADAQATKRAMRPENDVAPMIGEYHPNGFHNRVLPLYPIMWVGNPVDGRVDADDEVELLNQVQPGVYVCHKSDGSRFKVTAEAEHNERGAITSMKISFPCGGQNSRNHKHRREILREMLAQKPAPVSGVPVQLVTV